MGCLAIATPCTVFAIDYILQKQVAKPMLQYSLEQTHQRRLLYIAFHILTEVEISCLLNGNENYEVLTGSCKTTKALVFVRSRGSLRI